MSFAVLNEIPGNDLDSGSKAIAIRLFASEPNLKKVRLRTVIAKKIRLVIEVVDDQVDIAVTVKVSRGGTA